MGKIHLGRVVLGGLVMAAIFIIVELVVEGLADRVFGVNESEMLLDALGVSPDGARFHVVNIGYFLVLCILVIWVYAALRPKFGAGPKTAIITCVVFYIYLLLLWVNLVNLGVLPPRVGLWSLVFNAIELPIAVLAGASVYRESTG